MKFSYFLLLLLLPVSLCSDEKAQANQEQAKDNYEQAIYDWTRTLAEVLHLTGEKHYKVANIDESFGKGIDRLLHNTDPHSGFFTKETYGQLLQSTRGEFYGIGIVIDNTRSKDDRFLIVIDTIPEGPADKVGVQAFDKIIEIDGEPLEGMSTEEATAKLKGKKDTKVHIKVLREGEKDLLEFDITRDIIKEQNSLNFFLPDHNVYYLSLNMFTQNAIKQVEELIKQAATKNYKGIILDLRNNSGGLLNAVVDISGYFLDKGSVVVTTKDKNNIQNGEYKTETDPIANSAVPIFILINNYTASAAEILAGALKLHSAEYAKKVGDKKQDKLMVFLVGTTTFGKGSVQEVIPISNNCAVKLTTCLYFLPFDTLIQGKGIEPDFVIEKNYPPTKQIEWFNANYGQEKKLAHSINSQEEKTEEKEKKDKSKSNKKKTWAKRAKKMLKEDNQVRETITLINMLNTAVEYIPDKVKNREDAIAFLNKQHVTNKKIKMIEVKV